MRNLKGFTLIELMIVIAVIAIMLCIILQTLRHSTGDSVSIIGRADPNMGVSGGIPPDQKSRTLVCTDANGAETRDVAIPGEDWTFEGGVYVTGDANGHAITRSTNGKDCKVE